MILFTYKCKCGNIKDKFVKRYDDKVKCKCGEVMNKQVGKPSLGNMNKLGQSKSKKK